jgi:predicted  nucleic acid-binding Zn-ribbon protein
MFGNKKEIQAQDQQLASLNSRLNETNKSLNGWIPFFQSQDKTALGRIQALENRVSELQQTVSQLQVQVQSLNTSLKLQSPPQTTPSGGS